MAVQIREPRAQKATGFVEGDPVENNVTEDIEAPTTSSTSTLAEIESCEKHTVAAEDNGFAGHLQEI